MIFTQTLGLRLEIFGGWRNILLGLAFANAHARSSLRVPSCNRHCR